MKQRRWLLLALAVLLAIPLSGAVCPCALPLVSITWIQLTISLVLLLLILAAGAFLVCQGWQHQMPWISFRGKKKTSSDAERTLLDNISRVLEYMLQRNNQQLSQQIQTLQETFQNKLDSLQHDFSNTIGDLKKKQERILCKFIEDVKSTLQRNNQQFSQQIQTLQEAFQSKLDSLQHDFSNIIGDLKKEQEFSKVRSYKGNVTLDADTAHPRLEISADGRKVKDTGVMRQVPRNEKRFDSHLFVLAKEGYTSGKHYWEVYVGRRRSWALGIARESVSRKGPLTLSPQNGFWAIGLADGQDYWAYMDRWTRLTVSEQLQFIGIFLDMLAKQVTFYDVVKAAALYTFRIADGSSQEGKLIPFFSTGLATVEPDPEPLEIL